jgi:CheY-like chemotaxis protein
MPDVLIVDDDPGVRAALRGALQAAGFTCRLAASGRRALACAAEAWPDGVILDLTLAGALDGWETWAALNALAGGRALRVVVLTGDHDGTELACQRGVTAAISKSEPLAVVVWTLRRLLEGTAA